jgi:hypothetical protein
MDTLRRIIDNFSTNCYLTTGPPFQSSDTSESCGFSAA